MKRLLTVTEVASDLRVSKMTVYRLIKRGNLPAVRVGRGYRIKAQTVEQYLTKESIPPKTEG